jgi:hypothetical protein
MANPFKKLGRAAKKVGRAAGKATRAVDLSAKKSAIRGGLRKLDKKVGGQAGWTAVGAVAAGTALAVTGNVALGGALLAKGAQGLAAVHGDPRAPVEGAEAGAVAGDPGALTPSSGAATGPLPVPGSAPGSSTVVPGSSSGAVVPPLAMWARIRRVFTPRGFARA